MLQSGQVENGWQKFATTSGLIKWETSLTHLTSTVSNQVTSLLPSEVISHMFKEFSNIHLSVGWGSGTKTTTFNLLVARPDDVTQVIQTKEIFASGSRNGEEAGMTILPKNLYSSDGSFLESTHIMSPFMYFQDLASSGSGENTVTVTIYYAPGDTEEISNIYVGDVFRGFK
tara:strand:- start:532 stop:1047 length:516 start_codon:yes stop_codon:yes gene_type:complete